jgi:hypothetical protein
MTGFLNWSRGRAETRVDPIDAAMERVAGAVCRNLRTLGLFVECTRYGTSFFEIAASTSKKLITRPDSRAASGIALLLAGKYEPPTLVFEEINSLQRGLGRKMVAAVFAALDEAPSVIAQVRVDDLSPVQRDGRRWWEHRAGDFANYEWTITHGENEMRAQREDVAQSPDFLRRERLLERLAREFGYDPRKVRLSPERETIQYLGQSFTSEGDTQPDGSITIFYDPEMSDARLGCCLAHEIQHARYFAVRDAYRAEGEDGPLHRRFARYTRDALAAQRGVSDYSNEHWDAWKGAAPPALFSDELAEGGSEPINETIAEVAKALYNFGPDVRISPLWKELRQAINEEYERLRV